LTLKVDTFSVVRADGGGFGRQIDCVEALGTALSARENDRTETALQRRLYEGTTFDGCKNIAAFRPTCANLTRKQIVIATLEEIASLGTTNSKDKSEEIDLYQVQPTYEEGLSTQSFMAKSGCILEQGRRGEMFELRIWTVPPTHGVLCSSTVGVFSQRYTEDSA
jgi:hypothetical protein